MAVLSVDLMWQGDGGEMNDRLRRRYAKKFRVICDDVSDGPPTVMLAAGIPRIGDPYQLFTDGDAGAWCTRVRPQRTSEPNVYEVDAEYGSDMVDPALQAQNPLERPADIEVDFVTAERALEKDRNGKPILNSAGVPFLPPITMPENRLQITIGRNEPGPLDVDVMTKYNESTNSDQFWNKPPFSWKLGLKATRQYENGVLFWRVTYVLQYREDLWNPTRVLDAGFEELTTDNPPKLRVILDDVTRTPVSRPQLLDGQGHRLPIPSANKPEDEDQGDDENQTDDTDGNDLLAGGAKFTSTPSKPGVQVKAFDPVYLEFVLYKKHPFAALNLI
jgi:hypothetical protein